MRIAIAGASGTGKTTLARAIAEKYSLPINPVGARSVALQMGFDSPYDTDRAGRRVQFQAELFKAKLLWESEHEHFVTDRTCLDNLTYSALHMSEHLEENAIGRYVGSMQRYELVLVLSWDTFHKLDPSVNLESPGYHQMYEFLLRSLLDLSQIRRGPPVRGLGANIGLRMERAFETIDLFVRDGKISPPVP